MMFRTCLPFITVFLAIIIGCAQRTEACDYDCGDSICYVTRGGTTGTCWKNEGCDFTPSMCISCYARCWGEEEDLEDWDNDGDNDWDDDGDNDWDDDGDNDWD
eukprot:GFUD01133837.1.p2 GENE.GFUD01133837.1~~GFUD01133837.1.p2  ORF type:complete len:103 (+),score=10.47 GFUD01133837.1:49-357(+)